MKSQESKFKYYLKFHFEILNPPLGLLKIIYKFSKTLE
jgi:hypothetical protein